MSRIKEKDILDFISIGENDKIEFKIAVPSKVRELSEEICSFANAQGGVIVVGIDNDNKIVGCDIDNSKRSAIQNSIKEISPKFNCDFYSVTARGKNLWIIDVKEGDEKPYFVSGSVYMRQGSNSQKITDAQEVRALFEENGQLHYDARTIEDYDLLENIDHDSMKEFRQKARISPEADDKQVLENLELYNKNGQPLAGGIMFFAKDVERKFPQAVTHCVLFKGLDKVYIIDDKTFGGSLISQYEEANKWLESKLQVEYLIEDNGPRTELWDIPLKVLREAIANALSHRDYYETGMVTMVEVYDDRVTITNHGGMLKIVQKNFGHMSRSRNPSIFSLFTRMHVVEKVASGIPRMVGEMKEAGLPEPEMSYEDEAFLITFKRRSWLEKETSGRTGEENDTVNGETVGETTTKTTTETTIKTTTKTTTNLSKDAKKVLECISAHPDSSAEELGNLLGLTEDGVRYHIKNLKKEGIIKYEGATKKGQWIIISEQQEKN